jgi:hypothetical protein
MKMNKLTSEEIRSLYDDEWGSISELGSSWCANERIWLGRMKHLGAGAIEEISQCGIRFTLLV